MSGFIPMVSTTPPPIDDDDFGEFMDGSHAEQDDDFADFTSPTNYDDFSFPSLNSPEDESNSVNFHTEEGPPAENVFEDKIQGHISADKEVEVILKKTKSSVAEKERPSDSPMKDVPTCNGIMDSNLSKEDAELTSETTKDEDDWTDFDAVPPSDCKVVDGNSPVMSAHVDLHTFVGSPEPEDEDLPSNSDSIPSEQIQAPSSPAQPEKDELEAFSAHEIEDSPAKSVHADLHTFEGSPEPEDEDFPPDSDSIPSEQFRASPSPTHPKNDNFEAVSEDTTTNGNKDEISNGDSSSQSNIISGNTSEKLERETSSKNSNDYESSFQENVGSTEQSSENAECDQFRTGKTVDSDSEFGDFDSAISLPKQNSKEDLENNVISNSVSGDFFESEVAPTSNFADFESADQHNSGTSPVKSKLNSDVVIDKSGTSATIGDSESSSPEIPQNVEEFKADFDAFPSSSETAENDEEFADFGSVDIQSSMDSKDQTAPEQHNQNKDDIDTEFTAFENVSADDDGFADFSNAQSAQDTGFGDFSSGPASSWPAFSHTVMDKPSLKDKVANYCCKFSKKPSSEDLEIEEEHIPHLDEHLNSDVLPASKAADSPSTTSVDSIRILCPRDLWDQLEDIDNAIALNFLWNGSGHNKHLLDSLGMFTQNILFSGAKQAYYVPTYYAAGLGLVDPNKGVLKPMSAAEKITAMSPTDKNISATKEDLHPDEEHTEWKTIADDHSSGSMNVDGSWLRDGPRLNNRSGAEHTTSSDPVNIISSTMDLDFFDSLPSVGGGEKLACGTDLIDPELLELTSAPTTEPPPPPKDSGSATLSKILASITSSNNTQSASNVAPSTTQDNSKWEEEESKLSAEARSVLKKLPNLSYMKSKVLMFPINMSRVNIGDD